MAKFRNTVSGVVVDVDESTAMRLSAKWEPLDAEQPKKTTPRKKASPRKKTEPEPQQAPAEPEE